MYFVVRTWTIYLFISFNFSKQYYPHSKSINHLINLLCRNIPFVYFVATLFPANVIASATNKYFIIKAKQIQIIFAYSFQLLNPFNLSVPNLNFIVFATHEFILGCLEYSIIFLSTSLACDANYSICTILMLWKRLDWAGWITFTTFKRVF